MANCEDLHREFMTISTCKFPLLMSILNPSLEDNPLESIQKIVDIYHERVRENTADNELHEAFHTLLCYQYRLLVENKIEATTDYPNENLFDNLRKSIFRCTDNDKSDTKILNNIIVLQIILYLNIDDINDLFTEAMKSINEHEYDRPPYAIYFPIIEILVNAWTLRRRFKFDNIIGDIMTIGLLLDEIDDWLRGVNEHNSQELRPLISILIKLTSATDSPEALCDFLWDLIINNTAKGRIRGKNYQSLSVLYEVLPNLFSKSSDEIISMNINSCLDQKILHLISVNLNSERQKAQYVLRRIVDYLKEHSQIIPSEGTAEQLKPPFIFFEDCNFDIEELKSNYFLLLESLEEKQTHVVLHAMSHLDNLVRLSVSHESCFNKTWLRCLLTRILSYDDTTDVEPSCSYYRKAKKMNNPVIKAGFIALLRMDPQLFDNGLIKELLSTLNNPLIYDDQSSDPHPWIVKELSNLFIKAEQSRIKLTSKIILETKLIRWLPVPLFYLFEALGNNREITQVEHNFWGEEELIALDWMRISYERFDNRPQIQMMRVPMQMNILKCILIYVKPPLDLFRVESMIGFIASNGALNRGDDNWKLLSNYLMKNIEESNVWQFISRTREYLHNNGVGDSYLKSLAILIVLMFDSENIQSKALIISKILCPLLTRFNEISIRALQMISCLLKLSPRADDSYIMLIVGFSQSIFNFIRTRSMCDWQRSYFHSETINRIPMETFSAILDIQSLSPSFAKFITNMISIKDEQLEPMVQFIFSPNQQIQVLNVPNDILQSWYILNILYLSNRGCDLISNQAPPNFVDRNASHEITSKCYGLLASIYHRCVKQQEELSEEFVHKILMNLMVLAKTKTKYTFTEIPAVLREIIMKFKFRDDDKTIHDCIKGIINYCSKIGLRSMMEPKEFEAVAKELIELVLADFFIKIDDFKQIALDVVNDIISKSENTSASRYILFTRMMAMGVNDLFIFRDSILTSFLQTNAEIVDERIEVQACHYIMKNYGINLLNEKMELGAYMDVINRALLVTLILKMKEAYEQELSKAYVPQLISMLEKHKYKRYVGDSNVHKLKLRIMQVFLLLQHNYSEDDAVKIHNTLSESIFIDSDQLSVRILKEWNLMFCHHGSVSKESMKNLFSSARENRPENLISLMSIVYTLIFHLRDIYSLQTIFHEIPRLTNVSMDEWIGPEIFKLFSPTKIKICDIDIYNNDRALSALETLSVLNEIGGIKDSNLSQNDRVEETEIEREKLITDDSSLIVIASLIENRDVLTGKTADTLCVEERASRKRKNREDEYEYYHNKLNITADEWIINEVSSDELRDYLLEKKSMGWKLIGVEQTANKVKLCDKKFNEKTILLLGHRDGIPVDLIKLMDTCLEIPLMNYWRSERMPKKKRPVGYGCCFDWMSIRTWRIPESDSSDDAMEFDDEFPYFPDW